MKDKAWFIIECLMAFAGGMLAVAIAAMVIELGLVL